MNGRKTKNIPANVNDAISEAEYEMCNLAGIKTKRKRPININDRVKTLAIKCYAEQMPKGWDGVKRLIKATNKSKFHVIGICHNRDNVSNDAFEKSIEKEHYHIIIRTAKTHSKTAVVKTILNNLGIRYRPDEDRVLWESHGVELVGNFNIYTVYLLHETKQAQLDLKAPYKISEFVSNLSRKEIDELLSIGKQAEKLDVTTTAELENEAYQLGHDLKDWDSWYRQLPQNVRGHKYFRLVKEQYSFGVADRIHEDSYITRMSVFIKGATNRGKSYAIKKALEGKRIEDISAKKTGQFDDVTPTTEAIIVNDGVTTDILNLCDDNMIQLHRRNSGDPFWCGDTFVVTSNDDFEDWLKKCGVPTTPVITDRITGKKIGGEIIDLDAYKNRFFICHIDEIQGKQFLILDSPTRRGDAKALRKKAKMFENFREKFNNTIATYNPTDFVLDADEMNIRAIDRMRRREYKNSKTKTLR